MLNVPVAKRPSRRLRISELSRRADVPHATIQFYVRERLLPPPAKTGRTMAYYDEECVQRIALIKELQQRYLPLSVIRHLLDEREPTGRNKDQDALEEVGRQVQQALAPAERPLSPEQAASQLHLDPNVLAELEKLGIIGPRSTDGEYAPHDVIILRAVAKLARGGVNRDAGFETADLRIYLDAMRSLVATEVSTFLARATPRGSIEDVTRIGIAAATSATELMVAFRQKVIAEAVAALPLDPETTRVIESRQTRSKSQTRSKRGRK